MTLVTAPNLIEASDFSLAWHADTEASAVPPNGLLRVLNLLPDVSSGTPQVRKGFKRVTAALRQGYRVESVHPYNRISGGNEGQYLIIVMTNGTDNVSGNVAVYAHNLRTGADTLISPNTAGTPNKTWLSADGRHGGATILGKFYGFPPGDKMYAWAPGTGWEDDPSTPSWPTWNSSGTYTTSSDRPSDMAFERGDQVLYNDGVNGTRAFAADKDIRVKKWHSGEEYRRGHKVSIKRPWGGANTTYWRTYECKKGHTADSVTRPGDGTGPWGVYWRKVVLDDPADEDGRVADDWNLIPTAGQSSIAAWHAERLFIRYDNVGTVGRTRLEFSAPAKPKHGSDIGTLTWDPQDWRVGTKKVGLNARQGTEGDGGGWEDFRSADGDAITALWSFGYYLLVFKRRSSFVIGGTNPKTWTKRPLADVGAVGPRALCEHAGLVYFVSDKGFYRTDGTVAREVPGGERIRDWLRTTIDWEIQNKPIDVTMWSFGGYVWMSVPTGKGRDPDRVIVYEPESQGFWKLDLKVQAAAVNRIDGVDQLFFAQPGKVGTTSNATYAWLGTARRSQSTKSISGPEVNRNLFSNPSFEPRVGQTVGQALADVGWTDLGTVSRHKSVEAARRGRLGMVVTSAKSNGANFAGQTQSFADVDTTSHVVSGYFRRPHWRKHRKIDYSMVRLNVGGTLASGVHTYDYKGRGWWRVSATYVGSAGARNHGFEIAPGVTLQVEQMMCNKGALDVYFDGDGGEEAGDIGTVGGEWAMVMQYDHPDVQNDPSDDTAAQAYASEPIPWALHTAWFPFGAVREERRVRRLWSLVRGAVTCTLRAYRNYQAVAEFTAEQAATTDPATFFEGLKMPDAYAVSVSVEGLGAPAGVLSVALDTQPRRVRYHS